MPVFVNRTWSGTDSPLGTYDFFKRMSVIRAEKRALKRLAPEITRLARLEGLDDHARAVEARFKK